MSMQSFEYRSDESPRCPNCGLQHFNPVKLPEGADCFELAATNSQTGKSFGNLKMKVSYCDDCKQYAFTKFNG